MSTIKTGTYLFITDATFLNSPGGLSLNIHISEDGILRVVEDIKEELLIPPFKSYPSHTYRRDEDRVELLRGKVFHLYPYSKMDEEEEVYDEETPAQESKLDAKHRRRQQNIEQIGFYTEGDTEVTVAIDRELLDRVKEALLNTEDAEYMNPKVMTLAIAVMNEICNQGLEEEEKTNPLLPQGFPAAAVADIIRDEEVTDLIMRMFNATGAGIRSYERQIFIYTALLWKIMGGNIC